MVLKKEVIQWAKECIQCQDSKILTHVRAPLDNFSVPDKRFSHIHVDLVGPLPPSSGYTHIFTIVDRTTRWPEAISLRETSTIDRAKSLSAPGSPVSVSHKTLLLTGGQSLLHISGTRYHNSLVSNFIEQLHITLRPMV